MATGLTYLWACDDNTSTNPTGPASFVFNDYDEAYKYAQWLGIFAGIQNGYVIFIWTSGPSQNGYFAGTPWTFTNID